MSISIFLKVDGVTGESTDKNHVGWIDVIDAHWGATQGTTIGSGSGAGSGKANFNDLVITAHMDSATPALMQLCASGKTAPTVTISFCKAGGTAIQYADIILNQGVIVTGVQYSGASSSESVHMVYSFQAVNLQQDYWKQQIDGSQGAETTFTWNVSTNTAT